MFLTYHKTNDFCLKHEDLDAYFYDRWKSADNRQKNHEKTASKDSSSDQTKPKKDDFSQNGFTHKEPQQVSLV